MVYILCLHVVVLINSAVQLGVFFLITVEVPERLVSILVPLVFKISIWLKVVLICPTVIFLISVVCCILFLCLVVYLQSTNVAGIVNKFILNSLIFMIDLN